REIELGQFGALEKLLGSVLPNDNPPHESGQYVRMWSLSDQVKRSLLESIGYVGTIFIETAEIVSTNPLYPPSLGDF
ncbi:MAG: hypothetical protein MUP73_07190, partial [Dehalococcoidia bacterium]|nr:hypothetical protein [Dehalococcoidia bacterium]